MKKMKKIVGLILAMVMIFAMTVTGFATDGTGTGTETGKGSITVKNAVEGTTYTAYKIFDVVYSGDKTAYTYTIDSSSEWYDTVNTYTGGLTLEQVSNSTTYIVTIGDSFNVKSFSKHLMDNKPGSASGTPIGLGAGSDLKITGLDLGYYLVIGTVSGEDGKSTTKALCNLTTTDPDAEIYDKNEVPDSDKKILKDGGDEDTASDYNTSYNNAAIGDEVKYQIKGTLPSNLAAYKEYTYVFKDTLSAGLTCDENSIKVYVSNDETEKEVTNYFYKDATVNTDGTTSITVGISDILALNNVDGVEVDKDTVVYVRYTATVNENAVIGTAGNDNTVKLYYSNDPENSGEGSTNPPPENPGNPGTPSGVTPESKTITYVTGLELLKVDGADNNKTLAGAEFEIKGEKLNTVLVKKHVFEVAEEGTYYKLKDGTYTEAEPTDETTESYESTETKYKLNIVTETVVKKENVIYTGTTGADGILKFDGLAAGTYTITEITAPDGYNLLTQPISLTITCNTSNVSSTNTNCTWTVTGKLGNDDIITSVSTDGIIKLTVENKTGSVLPSTGGMGTTIFYVLGAILVLGAAILLVTKRRMNAEKE